MTSSEHREATHEMQTSDDLDLINRNVYASTTIPAPGNNNNNNNNSLRDSGAMAAGLVASITDLAQDTLHDLKFKETRGNELIPRVQMTRHTRRLLAAIAFIYLCIGFTMILLGALIHGLYSRDVHRHCPSLWWTGVPSTTLAILALYTISNKSRRYLFILSISSILVLFGQTAVMGAKGNFATALYSVWPLHVSKGRADLPVCQILHRWCHCQDYYHGVYSDLKMHHTKYIISNTTGTLIRWKNTGFKDCDKVTKISEIYYIEMFLFTCFIAVSLFCLVVGLMTTVASSELNIEFQPLDEEYHNDEEISHVDVAPTAALQ